MPPRPTTEHERARPERHLIGWLRWAVTLGLVAVAYLLIARLSLLLAGPHGNISPVWPPTGLAIAALVIGGWRRWPAIALGAFIANALTDIPLLVAVAIAVGNTLEAVLGALTIQRMRARVGPERPFAEPIGIVLAAGLAPVVSVSVGVASLVLAGQVGWTAAGQVWWTWWVGDAVGALLVAPPLLALGAVIGAGGRPTARAVGRALLVGLVTAAISGGVFLWPPGAGLLFCTLPALLLATRWCGLAGARWAALVVAAIGVWGTVLGTGPFVGGALNQNLLNVQLYLGALAVTALVLPVLSTLGGARQTALVLLVGWAISAAGFFNLDHQARVADETRFTTLIDEAGLSIRRRMTTYVDALAGGVGLFAASKSVVNLHGSGEGW